MLRPLQQLYNPEDYPDLLIGLSEPDDAAAYRLNDEQAIIVTTDFFTPIVDDPYLYGAIAAANSLSDVYAMGATPLLALNLVAIPNNLPIDICQEIIRGMAEKAREAQCVIAGGHTIQDEEPKVGLAVVGLVHPDKIMRKAGAQAGDLLVLSKPLGTGVIATAARQDKAETEHLINAAHWMALLNRDVSKAASQAGVGSTTDITGFGLLGHGSEMANSSNVTFRLDYSTIPFLNGTQHYADLWTFPGGTSNNKLAFEDGIRFDSNLDEKAQMLLFDAQTSGGLLISIAPDRLDTFASAMQAMGQQYWQIGDVRPREGDTAIIVQP